MRLKLGPEVMAYHVYGSVWDLFFGEGWKNWCRISIHDRKGEPHTTLMDGQYKPKSVLHQISYQIVAKMKEKS